MVEILNRQRKVSLPDGLREFSIGAAGLVPEAANRSIAVVFVSDDAIRKLNAEYRGKPLPTDVLSFPFEEDPGAPGGEHLGDIVISAETAARQARENGIDIDTELRQLILHGLLHLAGYDHETDSGEMNELELALRKKLSIDR